MKKQVKLILPLIIMVLFTSCGEISKKIKEQVNDLSSKTERLDSLLNKEFDKVMELDSIINLESEKVKALDSLIDRSTLKLDSIAKEKLRSLKEVVN